MSATIPSWSQEAGRPGELAAGTRVADRFAIEALVGAGGMGAVYRARDLVTGEPVALKVLQPWVSPERFEREARVLARLEHDSIVGYVAHGQAPEGPMYIAMEWLDGETLEQRLARGALTIDESVAVAQRVADALAVAHAQGIVHRDLKPSNVFLVDGDLARVKVLDFGIARTLDGAPRETKTGMTIGTPAYMAPEQARGEKEIDARVDVFSLGCVLFECIAGKPAFAGVHVMAVFAKILFEDVSPIGDIVPEVPDVLERLIARMLSKNPAARPPNAGSVADELAALREAPAGSARALRDPKRALTESEQRFVSVVIVGRPESNDDASPTSAAEAVLRVAARYDARAERLVDGSMILVLQQDGAATDQAARGARCALDVRDAAGEVPIALATGRVEIARGRSPVGEAIDKAVRLVRGSGPGPIRVETATASLLDDRFEVAEDVGGTVLVGRRDGDGDRVLLGKATPCFGREAEIAMLTAMFAQSIDEATARAALVTAAPGVGKSRLRQEFVRAARARCAGVEVWIASGEPVGAGSAFALAAKVVRRAAGVRDGEPAGVRREKLRTRVVRHVPEPDRTRVVHFLGEMTGTPFPDDADVQLQAARRDAILMGDQIRRAWEDFVGAETAAHPLLLVFEDLQWGDLPSVNLVDSTLRLSSERPLMVAAFARPDVSEAFPELWHHRNVQTIRLPGLARKASERLVRYALGERATDDVVARLVDRAAGNAFYLEELIRAVAQGGEAELPDTIVAMAHARLQAMDPDARRVLRAASVFGQVFWIGGVDALLGGAKRSEAERRLDELVRGEVLTRRSESRFAGEVELAFRHALVREGAYAMLTDADARLGHALAAAWLEASGETDAMALAEHFDRGGEAARAVGAYRRAAEQAIEGNDFASAIARADRGMGCGASGEALGALRVIQAEAHRWRGEHAASEQCALAALELLPRGSGAWAAAAGELTAALGRLGHHERFAGFAEDLHALVDGDDTLSFAVLRAAARTSSIALQCGFTDLGNRLLAAVEKAAGRGPADPVLSARMLAARCVQALNAGDPARYAQMARLAAAMYEHTGDVRSACALRASSGFGLIESGAFDEGVAELQASLGAAERMGLSYVAAGSKQNLGFARFRQGRLDEALALERAAIEAFRAQGDRRMEAAARLYLARILHAGGDVSAAETEARAALALFDWSPSFHAYALAALSRILLASGRTDEALTAARDAVREVDALGSVEEGEGLVRLALVEALEESGDRAAARAALDAATARLSERARAIGDPALRRSFVENIPEHARTLELASAWRDAG